MGKKGGIMWIRMKITKKQFRNIVMSPEDYKRMKINKSNQKRGKKKKKK